MRTVHLLLILSVFMTAFKEAILCKLLLLLV